MPYTPPPPKPVPEFGRRPGCWAVRGRALPPRPPQVWEEEEEEVKKSKKDPAAKPPPNKKGKGPPTEAESPPSPELTPGEREKAERLQWAAVAKQSRVLPQRPRVKVAVSEAVTGFELIDGVLRLWILEVCGLCLRGPMALCTSFKRVLWRVPRLTGGGGGGGQQTPPRPLPKPPLPGGGRGFRHCDYMSGPLRHHVLP